MLLFKAATCSGVLLILFVALIFKCYENSNKTLMSFSKLFNAAMCSKVFPYSSRATNYFKRLLNPLKQMLDVHVAPENFTKIVNAPSETVLVLASF